MENSGLVEISHLPGGKSGKPNGIRLKCRGGITRATGDKEFGDPEKKEYNECLSSRQRMQGVGAYLTVFHVSSHADGRK